MALSTRWVPRELPKNQLLAPPHSDKPINDCSISFLAGGFVPKETMGVSEPPAPALGLVLVPQPSISPLNDKPEASISSFPFSSGVTCSPSQILL